MRRLFLPIVIPLGALLGAATAILSIGLLLLWVGGYRWEGHGAVGLLDFVRLAVGNYARTEVEAGRQQWDLGLVKIAAPVVTALAVAATILVGAALAARGGRSRR